MSLGIWFLELHFDAHIWHVHDCTWSLKKAKQAVEIHKKDILSKDIEFVRENVDQGQRLLILDPSRKTIQFFLSIGIMCILKETLPSVLRKHIIAKEKWNLFGRWLQKSMNQSYVW